MELIINTLIWSAVFQGLLLGIIFIFSKKHRSFSNTLLGLFMITFIFGAINDLLPFDNIGKYFINSYFSLPEVKLVFPILFLHFVLEKLGRSDSYRKFLNLQYILAFAIIGITLINIILVLVTGNQIYFYFDYNTIENVFLVHQYYAFLLTVTVFIIAVIETIRYRNIARNEYSDPSMLSINWLWQFIFVLVPVIVLWGAEVIRILLGGMGQSDIVLATWLFVAIFNYFVSYKAFSRQDLFKASPVKPGRNESIPSPPGSVETVSSVENSVCMEIKKAMVDSKLYLNQDLSIHDFAKEINIGKSKF